MNHPRFLTAFFGLMILSLASCGGGNNPPSASTPAPASTTSPPAPTQSTVVAAANVVPITIDQGPAAVTPANTVPLVANLMYVTVTICVPGTQTCAVVDHVQVDTGSTGLRVFASALPAGFALPQRVDAHNNSLAECIQFVDGNSWGPLQTADLQMSGEKASSLPIQIIGSPSFSTVPTACSNLGVVRNTVQSRGANGILGIGNGVQDCGAGCLVTNPDGTAQNNLYYSCTSTQSCTATTLPLNAQVQNPITYFATDNNGSAIVLPTIPSIGALSVNGSLVFGIGTRDNNRLGYAVALQVDPNTFEFTTQYNGTNYSASYIDSGTNVYVVPNANNAIPLCTSTSTTKFFCPAMPVNQAATFVGLNLASSTVEFSISNASTLFTQNPYFTAFNDIGVQSGVGSNRNLNSFVWGAPFFFGKTVFTAIESKITPSSTPTPYVAF
jgi:hypothetical protein